MIADFFDLIIEFKAVGRKKRLWIKTCKTGVKQVHNNNTINLEFGSPCMYLTFIQEKQKSLNRQSDSSIRHRVSKCTSLSNQVGILKQNLVLFLFGLSLIRWIEFDIFLQFAFRTIFPPRFLKLVIDKDFSFSTIGKHQGIAPIDSSIRFQLHGL